jgi:hypothetical protein
MCMRWHADDADQTDYTDQVRLNRPDPRHPCAIYLLLMYNDRY